MRRAPVGVGLSLGVSPPGLASPAGSLYPKKKGDSSRSTSGSWNAHESSGSTTYTKHDLILSVRSVAAA